jgi:hypothetical protein
MKVRMMGIIIPTFMVGAIVLIERGLFFLKQRRAIPPQHIMALMDKGRFTDTLALIEQNPTPALRVLAAGMTHRLHDPPPCSAQA